MRTIFTLTLISLAFLVFFFNHGFAYYDEGFILHAAQRVIQGEIPYKDFDFIYTPGTIFLLAAVFKVFGESILVGRILTMAVGVLTALLIYFITNRISKNKLVSFLAMLVYLAWGPSHINFPWPTLFAFSTGLLATSFLNVSLIGSLDSKKSALGMTNAFMAGIMAFVTFLFKQNFGVAVFLSSVLGMVLIRLIKKTGNILNFLIGIAAGLSIFLVYLISTDSFTGFLDNFYFYTIKKIILDGLARSAFPSGIKGLFYLLPGLISLTAIFVAYKRQRKYIVWPLFTFFFYLFGIRPTTDYPHLSILMAMTGIPLAIILGNTTTILDALRKSSLTRMTSFWLVQNLFNSVIYGSILLIISAGFFTGLFKNYYRWDSPIIKQKYYISGPREKIFVDQKFNKAIPEIIEEIDKNTAKNDYIFIFPNAPMFYFLTERKNPTRYINLPLGLHTSSQEQEVIDDLRRKRVRLILTNEPPENSNYPVISEYIFKNYKNEKEIFEFTLWEKDESGRRSEVQSK